MMKGPCLLLMGLRDLGKFLRGWGLGIMWSPLMRGAWWSLCIQAEDERIFQQHELESVEQGWEV